MGIEIKVQELYDVKIKKIAQVKDTAMGNKMHELPPVRSVITIELMNLKGVGLDDGDKTWIYAY